MKSDLVCQWLRRGLPISSSPVVWLIDVDDTLVDTRTMHHHAAGALTDELARFLPLTLARSISQRFVEVFDELILVHQQSSTVSTVERRSLVSLEERVSGYQEEILVSWGQTRPFSREVMLRIAVEDCRASLRSEEIHQCIDKYWADMINNPVVFPDAVRLSQMLRGSGTPTYLMTSSDARYREKSNGQFSYDPIESGSHKSRRIERLRQHGIFYSRAFIGDPIDKPSVEYFKRVVAEISKDLRLPLGSFPIIVVGDSYRSDLEVPMGLLDSAIGVLIKRGQSSANIESERVLSVGNFNLLVENLNAVEER